MRVVFDIISSDKRLNAIMHAFDVVEKHKHFGKFERFEAEAKEDINLSQLTENMRLVFEQAGKIVVFLSMRAFDNRINDKYPPFIMEGVAIISDGQKWGMFKDVLEQLGYKCECNDRMQVLSAKIKI